MNQSFRPPHDNSKELLHLAHRMCDGFATTLDRDRLDQMLQASEGARQAYLAYLNVHAALLWRHRGHPLADLPAAPSEPLVEPRITDTVAAASTGPPLKLSENAQAVQSPLFGFLGAAIRLVPGGEFTVGFLLIAAVVSAFVGLATFVLRTHDDGQRLALDRGQAPAAARLTATEHCQWDSTAPRLGTPVEGKLLRVGAGIAEFTLAKAVRVVVEGPATFEVVSADRFRLDRGKLAATVPPRGIGFTVVTPTAEVIDLGTEFGVEVNGADQTDVQVLKGEVEVRAKSDATAVPESNKGVRLSAGEAVRVSKGLPAARIPADAARFSRVLRPISPKAEAANSPEEPPNQVGPPSLSFVEDFHSGTPGPHLVLGEKGGSPTVDFSHKTFAITSGIESRIYLGTRGTSYALVNFVFEATAIMPAASNAWGDAFFGMGTSTPGFLFEPAAPSVLAVVRIDLSPNSVETRGGARVSSTTIASGDASSPKLSGKTVRLRMTWTAKTKMALFEIDGDYADGRFQPAYNLTVDGSGNFFERWDSRLICGGGNGLQFDDIRVTVMDEPAPSTAPAAN